MTIIYKSFDEPIEYNKSETFKPISFGNYPYDRMLVEPWVASGNEQNCSMGPVLQRNELKNAVTERNDKKKMKPNFNPLSVFHQADDIRSVASDTFTTLMIDVPGTKKENIDISLSEKYIHVTWTRDNIENKKSIFVNTQVYNIESLTASLDLGVLSIVIPHVEKKKPKTIKIT